MRAKRYTKCPDHAAEKKLTTISTICPHNTPIFSAICAILVPKIFPIFADDSEDQLLGSGEDMKIPEPTVAKTGVGTSLSNFRSKRRLLLRTITPA